MFPAALAVFLSLFLFCAPPAVVAAPWVVTSYYQSVVSTYLEGYTASYGHTTIVEPEELITKLINVEPTATAIPTLSVITGVDDYYTEVTVVNVLVPTGVGKEITYDYYATSTTSYYGYYLKFSFTASASCDPRWVFTTSASAYLPPMITPTPTSVSTKYTQRKAFGPTSTYYYAFIDPTFLPSSTVASMKSYAEPYFTDSCTVPSYYQDGVVTPGEGDSGSRDDGTTEPDANGVSCRPADYYDRDSYYSYYSTSYYDDGYRTLMKCSDGTYYWTKPVSFVTLVVLTVVLGWFGLFLIIGLIESWIAFSRLARGKPARRGLPMSFAALAPFLSCFLLFCHIRGFNARSLADQETMAAEWKATGFFTKLGRWVVWGFRYKYPTFLGTAPTRRKKWSEKGEGSVTPNDANAMVQHGPSPPPGTMYVVANPAGPNQGGNMYLTVQPGQPGQPGPAAPPPNGWYAPQVPVNGQQQQQYIPYQPQSMPPQPQQQGGSPQLPPRAHLAEESGRGVSVISGPSTGSPVSPASGLAATAVPGVVSEAGGSQVVQGRGVDGAGAGVGSGSEISAMGAAGAAGGASGSRGPSVPGPGFEPGTGDGTIHEAPAGDVRGDAVVVDEGKGGGVAPR